MTDGYAQLSSFGAYTTFTFADTTLTFRTCSGLERYTAVLLYDNGYLEVMAKYRQCAEEIEEYIDLLPMLENLYMDADAFLAPIKGVELFYAGE